MSTETDEQFVTRIHAEHAALPGDERLWCWFGLSRASWLTMPRVLMHAMPAEWQGKMATLLDEFEDEFRGWCKQQLYVVATEGGKFAPLPETLCNYRHPHRDEIDTMRNKKEAA